MTHSTSTIISICRSDFRRSLSWIGLLCGILAVLVVIRLGWFGGPIAMNESWSSTRSSISSMLEHLLSLVTLVVAAKLVFDSVYDDLIFWRKGNLATRPVGGGQVWLAKFLFLFLFLAGPFALAAVVYLGLMGMPGTVVLLGAAQSLIQSFAAILLLIPLFLLWRFSQLAALALVLAALATGAFHFLPQLISRSIPTKSVPYPAVPEASVPSFEMAELSITTTFVENEPHLAFSLVPSLPVPVDRDVVWAFASARLGQKPLSMKSPCKAGFLPVRFMNSVAYSYGMEAALARHLGTDLKIIFDESSAYSRIVPSRTRKSIKIPAGEERELSFEAVLEGHVFSWDCIADLPLEPGSKGSEGDDIWTFTKVMMPSKKRFLFFLKHVAPQLWLEPQGSGIPFEDRGYHFVLFDPEHSLLYPFEDNPRNVRMLGRNTGSPRRTIILSKNNLPDLFTEDLSRLRLLILRPHYKGTQFFRWGSPSSVQLPLGKSSLSGHDRVEQDLRADDITRWIEANPAPHAKAPKNEITSFIVALLEQTNRCDDLLREHPAIQILADYASDHLDLLLEAVDALERNHFESRWLLEKAIESGMGKEQLPQIVERVREHPMLLRAIAGRGWGGEVLPELASLLRNGFLDLTLIEVLTSEAGASLLSREEWLAVFRLRPDTYTYRYIKRVPGLEPELNAMVDARMENYIPMLDETSLDPLLELALVRGHPKAPAYLQEAAGFWKNQMEERTWVIASRLREYIASSYVIGRPKDEENMVSWFLEEDPADFEFDEARGKYRLKGASK